MTIRPEGGMRSHVGDALGQNEAAETVGDYARVVNAPYKDNPSVVTPGPMIQNWLHPPNVTAPRAPSNPLKYGDLDEWQYEEIPPGSNVDPTLVRVGSSPIWISPNDRVEPWDCVLWPNSPYCGSVPGLNDIPPSIQLVIYQTQCEMCMAFEGTFLGIKGPPSRVCYRRFSDGACKIPAIPETQPPTYPEGDRSPRYPMPVAPPGMVRTLYAGSVCYEEWVDTWPEGYFPPLSSTAQAYLQFKRYVWNSFPAFWPTTYRASVFRYTLEPGTVRAMPPSGAAQLFKQPWESSVGYVPWVSSDRVQDHPRVTALTYNRGGATIPGWSVIRSNGGWGGASRELSLEVPRVGVYRTVMRQHFSDATWFYWRDWPISVGQSRNRFYLTAEDWASHITEALSPYSAGFSETYSDPAYSDFYPRFRQPPNWLKLIAVAFPRGSDPPIVLPPPTPQEPDPMDCCQELMEKVELIEMRLGCKEFPVDIPASLVAANAGQVKLDNHAQFSAWFVRNLDSLFGQFPVKLTIADSDPTKSGDQEVEVELPNLAEAIAEIFGLAYQSEIKTDLVAEMLMRLIPEVIAAKNASIVGQSYAKANASYMGYAGNLKPTEISSNFNLEKVNSLPEFLKESKGKLLTFQEQSNDTLQDKLERLMFAAGIIKSVFMVDGRDADRLIETINQMFDDEGDNLAANKRSWPEWLRAMEKNTAPGNRGQRIVPDVVPQVPPDGPEPE